VLIAWLSTLAHAGCPPLSFQGTSPVVGAVDVPIDHPAMVVVDDGPCAANLSMAILNVNTGQPQQVPTQRTRVGTSWVYRAVDLPLQPGTDHTLAVSDGRAPAVIPFQTGQRAYEPPQLSLSITDAELYDAGDGLSATIRVFAETSAGNLLHFTGAMLADEPTHARLSEGGTTIELVQAQVIDGLACVSVRAETFEGNRTPWVQTCELVEEPDIIDTATFYPRVETGYPVDTGYYDWYGYGYGYDYYESGPDFVIFSCGGCQSSPGSAPLALLPLTLFALRRRRR